MQRFPSRKLSTRVALLGLVVLVFALSGTSASAATTVTARDAMEPGLIERINDIRAAHGLRRLRGAADLSKAAAKHANSMGAIGYFKHDLYTPSRKDDWTSYGTWIRWYWAGPGYTSWSAGENLAWGAPDMSARQAASRWMDSAPHRANILTASWRRIGVAAVHVSDPRGYYGSWSDVTIFVAEFGRRS
jgi:uncharacterized protein YkwD